MSKKYLYILFIFLSVLVIFLSLSIGIKYINILNIMHLDRIDYQILMYRIRKIIISFTIGAALSVAGAGYQTILRNPLAEPYILGISSGASLGVILTIIFGSSIQHYIILSINAFLGAAISLIIVLLFTILKYNLQQKNNNLIINGVIISTVFNSIIMLLISISNIEQLNTITWWMLGSLEFDNLEIIIKILFIVFLSTFLLLYYSKKINILCLGNELAYSLGVSPIRISILVLFISSLMIAIVVSISGIIGFVGFIIPHIIRKLINNSDHIIVFPTCFFVGGMFLVLCEAISRLIFFDTVIPIGVVTSLIGGPIFIFILNKGKLMYE